MKDTLKIATTAIVCLMLGAFLMFCIMQCSRHGQPDFETIESKHDTIRITDTITLIEPVPVSIVTTDIQPYKLPVHVDTVYQTINQIERDSVYVDIPISQKVYEGEQYNAWVSGFEAKLDSIRIFSNKEIITIEKTIKNKPKRWGIGFYAGYGYTPHGFQPSLGISISYNIWNF